MGERGNYEKLTNEELVAKMQENPEVVDNHDGDKLILTGLVEFNNECKGLACMVNALYYSLNDCYFDEDDNSLHLSTCSIGGVLWGGYPDAEQLKKYNESCCQEGGKIKCCHMADGTKIYPAA